MEKKPIDLGLTALDELFMTDEGRMESKLPRIHDIPLDQIDDMPNHPYKVRMDEDMEALVLHDVLLQNLCILWLAEYGH